MKKLNTPLFCFLLLLLVYGLTLVFNDGFMATDEYWVGITRYIPAQTSSLFHLVGPDDVKSPLQILPMFAMAKLSYWMGVINPYLQYRFVIASLAIFNLFLLIAGFRTFADDTGDGDTAKQLLYLMLAFYFAAPFSLTRPMFESLAAPWLTLAGVYALRYDRDQNIWDLLLGVVFVSMAFVLRQQVGFCALVFIILTVLKKNKEHFFIASGVGFLLFLLTGIPDSILRGGFHQSLISLTTYNFEHGGDYGHQPITFYPLLIAAITFLPFFILRYPRGFVRTHMRKYRSLWIMLFLFVFLHSLFPQKWERFVISVVPLLLLLMYPYFKWIFENRHRHRRRLYVMMTVNFILFFPASFFPPQENLIQMSLYLDKHPEIRHVYRIHDTPGWITDAFIRQKRYAFRDVSVEELANVKWNDCTNALVLPENVPASGKFEFLSRLALDETFRPNIIERAAYRMNPKKNPRRVSLNFFTCGQQASNQVRSMAPAAALEKIVPRHSAKLAERSP